MHSCKDRAKLSSFSDDSDSDSPSHSYFQELYSSECVWKPHFLEHRCRSRQILGVRRISPNLFEKFLYDIPYKLSHEDLFFEITQKIWCHLQNTKKLKKIFTCFYGFAEKTSNVGRHFFEYF